MPGRIDTKRIDLAVEYSSYDTFAFGPIPPRSSHSQVERENVVVEETSIDSKETHQKDDVLRE